MFVTSFTFESNSMAPCITLLVVFAAACYDSETWTPTRYVTAVEGKKKIQEYSRVLVENRNIEIYMAAERGFITKPSDTFDGQTKSFEDFQFDMQNTLTYTPMTARGEMERGAVPVMMTILERGGRMALDESKNRT